MSRSRRLPDIVHIDQFCVDAKMWVQTYVVIGAHTVSVNGKVFVRPVRYQPRASRLRKMACIVDKAYRWKRHE